jgi:hypothetical protein
VKSGTQVHQAEGLANGTSEQEHRLAYSRARRDTKDPEYASGGKAKTERIDLGLALLEALVLPVQRIELYDMAVWCGCTDGAIFLIQQRALKKLRNRFRFGDISTLGREIVP